jgi:hypothetical protein
MWTLAICGVFLGGLFGVRFFMDRGAEADDAEFVKILKAGGGAWENSISSVEIDTLRTPEEVLAALSDIEGEVQDSKFAPFYYWLVSTAAYNAAEGENEDFDLKLAHYARCRDACVTLSTDHADTPWVKIPWRSSSDPKKPNEALVQRRQDYCESQIQFIEEHKGEVGGTMVPDDGVVATLTLRDANDQESPPRAVPIKIYSSAAPIAVAQLKSNIESGFWKGRHVFGLAEADDNDAEIDAVMLGSPLSKSPWAWEEHGRQDDTVGCTLPLELNRLSPKRGTVAFDLRWVNNSVAGASPTNLVIHTADRERLQPGGERVVFGMIDDEEALAWLEALAYDKVWISRGTLGYASRRRPIRPS